MGYIIDEKRLFYWFPKTSRCHIVPACFVLGVYLTQGDNPDATIAY